MSAFFHMGGYARFVWPAYAFTLAIVVLNIRWARRSLAQAQAAARRRVSMSGAGP
jgi:heme exporter protein CcmD